MNLNFGDMQQINIVMFVVPKYGFSVFGINILPFSGHATLWGWYIGSPKNSDSFKFKIRMSQKWTCNRGFSPKTAKIFMRQSQK